MKKDYGMTPSDEGLVHADLSDPLRGRIDRSRMGKHNPNDTEPRPIVTPEDRAETLRLIALDKNHAEKVRLAALDRERKAREAV